MGGFPEDVAARVRLRATTADLSEGVGLIDGDILSLVLGVNLLPDFSGVGLVYRFPHFFVVGSLRILMFLKVKFALFFRVLDNLAIFGFQRSFDFRLIWLVHFWYFIWNIFLILVFFLTILFIINVE